MTDSDLVRDAVAELYGAAPHEFISRRATLAAQARAAGQQPAAKQIAALRKPTQSAWIVNQLARTVPDAGRQLSELGAELRAAQRTLNGAAIRELSMRRRELVDDLARRAFTAVGQESPPAALRDEVMTTLAAAVADPQIADELESGAMVRAARSDGFGATGPLLSLVPSAGEPSAPEAGQSAPRAERKPALVRPGAADDGRGKTRTVRAGAAKADQAGQAGQAAAPAPAGRKAAAARPAPQVSAAAAEKARQAQRRRTIAEAEKAAARADQAAAAATRAEQKLESTVEQLEEKLAEARQQLVQARGKARRARVTARQVRQSLERLRRP